jgi:hypothetical protein
VSCIVIVIVLVLVLVIVCIVSSTSCFWFVVWLHIAGMPVLCDPCPAGDDGMAIICEGLKDNRSITSIDLPDNCISVRCYSNSHAWLAGKQGSMHALM